FLVLHIALSPRTTLFPYTTLFRSFNTRESSQNGNKGKIYTAEEIYAMMFMEGIDIEFENRNLNRLMTMLRIIGNYKVPPKKMTRDRKSTRLNSSHVKISYAVFCLK